MVLEKDKMTVNVDGEDVAVEDEFVEDGTEAIFTVAGQDCCIHTRKGPDGKIEQTLFVGDTPIAEKFENRLLI